MLIMALATLLLLQPLTAQMHRFERIGLAQGLYQRHITVIYQDTRGFMWFGTSDGLICFDGYTHKTFRFDPFDAASLSGNDIYGIYEDRRGWLWVKTSGGGINRYDPTTQAFTLFHHSAEDSTSLGSDDISAFLEDSRGNLWIGSNGGGIGLYDPGNDHFHSLTYDPANANSLSSNAISVLLEDPSGYLWAGSNGGGISRFHLPENPLDKSSLKSLQIERIYAQNPTYLPLVYDSLRSHMAKSHFISRILWPQQAQDYLDFVQIRQPTLALIVATGLSSARTMSDYGWLEAEDESEVLWEMTHDASSYLSGETLSRIQIGLLRLAPGTYRLRYRTGNDLFIPQTYRERQLWGIHMLALTPREYRFFEKALKGRSSPDGIPHNWIGTLAADRSGRLFAGTAEGLAVLQLQDGGQMAINPITLPARRPEQSGQNDIQRLLVDGQRLWVVTATGEAFVLNPADKRIRSLREMPSSAGIIPHTLRFNQIHRDIRGRIWLGSESHGLVSWEPPLQDGAPAKVRRMAHAPDNLQSLSDNAITAIFQDQGGILWVGTARGGLNKLNRTHQHFQHITHTPGAGGLSNPVVTALLEDHQERIWAGSDGGGLSLLTRSENAADGFTYRHFRHQPDQPQSLPSDRVSCIYQDQNGNIWVGTHGGGLAQVLFNDEEVSFIRFQHIPLKSNSISSNDINTISEDQYGQLWIGSNSGLNKLDRLTRRFTRYQNDPVDPHSLSDNEIWSIYEDSYSQGRQLWIGTRKGGINRFDRQNNHFIRYSREFDNPYSLNNPAVLSIFQDHSGNMWFGTYSGGLNRFDRETEQFTYFTEHDGLANNMIFGILEDRGGNLWLSTNNGLSRFDPLRRTFQNFDMNDGLQANEFNAGACFATRRGELLFGGVNGFNLFYPDSVRKNDHLPPVRITRVNVMGDDFTTTLRKAVKDSLPMALSYRQNTISFEFAALDFDDPAKNRYAYRVDGVHEDWIDLGDRRSVTFTNLPPGSYVFRVRGANNDGVWNSEGTAVQIQIHPPFWLTWWFITLLGALILAGIAFGINHRIHLKLRRLMEIEQVRNQESERVRAKAAHDFHDELGHKLTKITLFSEIIKRQLQSAAPETIDYLSRISDTAKGLTDGMRDFIWTLDPGKDSLYEVVVRLKDFGDNLFDKTGINFRLEGLRPDFQKTRLTTDWRRHLTLIFKEAMNNALKHAACKNVVLSVQLHNSQLIMRLTDDGAGMPGNIYPSRDVPGNGHAEHTRLNLNGNGLKNMSLRAEKISGNVRIQPHKPRGTRIELSAKMP